MRWMFRLEEVDSAVKDYVLAVSRTALVHHPLGSMVRLDYESLEAPSTGQPVMERFEGGGSFTSGDWKRFQQAYGKQFKKSLPVSAHVKRLCIGRLATITRAALT